MTRNFALQFANYTAAFEAGIVPILSSRASVNEMLKDTPPDEARKMRRKFRKLWRRIYRQNYHHLTKGGLSYEYHFGVGLLREDRTKKQCQNRKSAVYLKLNAEYVAPLYDKLCEVKR
jgi:hypothetical protein